LGGRSTKWGNPFEYRTPQGLVRYRPEAPEEWEYEAADLGLFDLLGGEGA
jgi:hypothetical protein